MAANFVALLLIVISVAMGYALATWGPLARHSTPIERFCSRLDYMNGLQRKLQRVPIIMVHSQNV
jgi:hypothetical protein